MSGSTSRAATVRAIADHRGALLRLLNEVDDGAMASRTRCDPWTVSDVVAHLVDGEVHTGRIFRGEVDTLGFVDAAEGVARWGVLPGEAIRAALWQHGTATQRALDAMGDDRWRATIDAFGCSTIGRLARLHLFEGLIHGLDITDALGQAPLWGPYLAFATEFALRAGPAALGRLGVVGKDPIGLAVGQVRTVLPPQAGRWRLSLGDEAPGLTASPEAFVRAVTGRGGDGLPEGSTVTGDHGEVERILGAWRMYAAPPT